MIIIAPASVQIAPIRNEYGVLAHSDTYAIDYGQAIARQNAKVDPIVAETIAMDKITKGTELNEADRAALRARTTYSIYRKCRQGWSAVDSVLGRVALSRRIAAMQKAGGRPGQARQHRAKTTGGEWIYFTV